MASEDDIDAETLQARVDLSMANMAELVSSWIKPSVKASLPKSDGTAEREIEELMRRPPRLGVGAPIPENANTMRENTRIRTRLVGKPGKKRFAEEKQEVKRDDSDDEEESRAGAIKKKFKLDPFVGNFTQSPPPSSVTRSPPTTPESRLSSISVSSGPPPERPRSMQSVLSLEGPILNLDGPPPNITPAQMEASGSKGPKKRRRRKKRKSSITGDVPLVEGGFARPA